MDQTWRGDESSQYDLTIFWLYNKHNNGSSLEKIDSFILYLESRSECLISQVQAPMTNIFSFLI
jgi:hypothetical protein